MGGWINGRMDGRMDGWTSGLIDGWVDGSTEGWTEGWTDGWMEGAWKNENGWGDGEDAEEWMDGRSVVAEKNAAESFPWTTLTSLPRKSCVWRGMHHWKPGDGWVDGWVDGWMGGWIDGWMGGWMDGWVDGWWMDG